VKFRIDIDDTERLVEVAADGTVVIDGKSFKTKVSGAGNEKRTVQVGEKTHEVRLVKRTDGTDGTPEGFVFELDGERVPVTIKDVTESAPGAAAAASAVAPAAGAGAKAAEEHTDGIFAPVPGKIVDIKVKVGDTVKEGDLVLILEAMKMENELHAPKQATIAALLVSKGDQATKGQLLVAFG
jgi:biotin carboxyl carrier protein